jgi:hypothetical protein
MADPANPIWPELPYGAWQDTRVTLLAFLQSTYEAAANAAPWDLAELECSQSTPGVPREA